jgi:hypothetical protein
VTTGAWIEPDVDRQVALVSQWTRPDYTTVKLSGDAVKRGVDTRVGLEDTVLLPDGTAAPSNVDLVRAAYDLGADR